MPDSPSEDQVVDTSTTTTPTESTQTTNSDSTSATSSTAQKPAETLLDRIQSVLKKPGDSPTSETSGSTADADPAHSSAKSEDGLELSPDEAKSLSQKSQERFKRLASDVKAKSEEIKALEPRAKEFDKIDTFIKNAGLSPQDVGSTLQIAAMLRSDPKAARARLQPIMAELDRILGEELPPEIKARVDQGYLTAEDAKALSRATADAALSTKRANELAQTRQQEDTFRSKQADVKTTLDAVDVWEKQKAKSDPDWNQKQAEISEQVEIAIERKSRELKQPWWPSPQEAVQLSEEALKLIDSRYKRFAPKPRAIDPPVTTGASPRSTPAPKNTMDIIRQNLGR